MLKLLQGWGLALKNALVVETTPIRLHNMTDMNARPFFNQPGGCVVKYIRRLESKGDNQSP
jgi:hypothetical protein